MTVKRGQGRSLSLCYLSIGLLLIFNVFVVESSSSSSSTIPRSNPRRTASSSSSSITANKDEATPPWNPSDQIDEQGFLKQVYSRLPGEWEGEANIGGKYSPNSQNYASAFSVPVSVRQVPGDGNCLFHSLSASLAYAVNGTHRSMASAEDLKDLQAYSSMLRRLAVATLEKQDHRLFLQGKEYLLARDLVQAAAAQYDMSGERYCQLMKRDCYWGGGPEIVALCNVLQRPIHVYELVSTQNQTHFCLRRMACFGSPKFDCKGDPLCILSADSRFPDVAPGRHLASGNHFLALFPFKKQEEPYDEDPKKNLKKKRRKRRKHAGGVRGGDLPRPKNILNDKNIRITNLVLVLEYLVDKIFQVVSRTDKQ